jgi:hypothetical protein
MRIVLSVEPVASRDPSGEKAAHQSISRWPSRTRTTSPVLALHLDGGADVYGLTWLTSADFSTILAKAPPGAIAALVRLDAAPAGYLANDVDFDTLAVINLGANSLNDPELGVLMPDQSIPLQIRGVVNNPAFGGVGPIALDALEPNKVWITLVPEAAMNFTLRSGTLSTSIQMLSDGNAIYLVQSCPADIDGGGTINVDDLLAVIAAWGPCQPPPTSCPADIAPDRSGDGQVNVDDLLAVIGEWGACP